MTPDKKTENRNGQTREGNELIAEDILASKVCNQFANDAHAGQDHDIDSRVRIKPEQVLKQNRVASNSRVKNSNVSETFKCQQQNCDSNHRGAQNHDETGGIHGPDK